MRRRRKVCEGQLGLAETKARYRSTLAPFSSLRRMIHSASFRATGSVIAAAVWVASSGLCLRIRSMTVSSVSMSALGVDWVAATTAGKTGLRGGAAGRWGLGGGGGGRAAGGGGGNAGGGF